MAITAIVQGAAAAAQAFGPEVLALINQKLNAGTGGQVTDLTGMASFAGNDSKKALTVVSPIVRAGADPATFVPAGLKLNEASLALQRDLNRLYAEVSKFTEAHTMHFTPQIDNLPQTDEFKIKSVAAVQRLFGPGSKEDYLLAMGGSGVPRDWFEYAERVKAAFGTRGLL